MRLLNSPYLEHLSGALTVAGGNNRGVHVQEAILLEKLVRGKSQRIADACHGADCVCTRTQVHLLAQELIRGFLLGNWVRCGIASAHM